MATKKSVRLSPKVVPYKYEVHLTPDLEAFAFAGTETIHVTLATSFRAITLHSKELEIESVEAVTKSGTVVAETITYDEGAETATFRFKHPLPKGAAQLHIVFRGILNDKMRGFYRSSYEHGGVKKHLATTQFESTDARRAFPCFDEPAQKAIFEVSLTVLADKTAISNTLPIEIKEHESGYKTLRFSPTPPMSTYLLAFIVGDFEVIEKKSTDGVLVRVFTTPGKIKQAEFALETAAKVITFFNEYFAIRYPLPSIDLIAIPDFAAGAMENWGAVTYRESALLVDPEHSSTMNKQWVALVIAHELAHQWFGNLVTMEWWTHLWLNEGFASYIEYLAVDKIFPSWDIWTQFLVADMRPALHLDGLLNTHPIEVEVHHPSEIAAVFDAVSYSKGASIIRMLAEYLGEKHFRDGLRYYLKKHTHGNALTEDLWSALEKISRKPVKKMMANWTGKSGYPLLRVEERGGNLVLEQSRFFSSPLSAKKNKEQTVWHVPVSIATERGRAKGAFLLGKKTARMPKPRAAWVKLNADESAFFRTRYSPALRDALAEAARAKKLNTRDRLGLVRDIFALAENGTLSATEALQFAASFTRETEYVLWAELASNLAHMHTLVSHEKFAAAFESQALALFREIGKKYDWNAKPKDHSAALLKVLVLGALAKYGDEAVRAHAYEFFTRAAEGSYKIPADLRGVVYGTVARYGGAAEYDMLLKMYRAAELHEEKNRLLSALTNFRDKDLLQQALKFGFSDEVRLQDKWRLFSGVTQNPAGTDLAWKFITKHWKQFVEWYGGTRDLLHLIEPFRVSTSKQRAKELKTFVGKHNMPGMQRTLEQTLEQINANARWLERNKKDLSAFLKK